MFFLLLEGGRSDSDTGPLRLRIMPSQLLAPVEEAWRFFLQAFLLHVS